MRVLNASQLGGLELNFALSTLHVDKLKIHRHETLNSLDLKLCYVPLTGHASQYLLHVVMKDFKMKVNCHNALEK